MQSNYARTSASSEPLYSVDPSQVHLPSDMNNQESATSIGDGDDILAATQAQHYAVPIGDFETQFPQTQYNDAPWDPLPVQREQSHAANSLPNAYSSSQPIPSDHQNTADPWRRSIPDFDFNLFYSSQPRSDGSHLLSNYDYSRGAFSDGMGTSPHNFAPHLLESSYTGSTAASETEMLFEGESFHQQPDDVHLLFSGNQNAEAGINVDSDMEGIEAFNASMSEAPSSTYPASAVPLASYPDFPLAPYDIGIGDHLLSQPYSYPGNPPTGSLPNSTPNQPFNATNTGRNVPTFSFSSDASISLSQQSTNIADRRSSNRHEGDIAGSYPPTAHHYPAQHSCLDRRLKDETRSRPRSFTLPQQTLIAPASRIGGRRRRSSNSGSNLNSRGRILEAIDEGGEASASDAIALFEGEDPSASAQAMALTGSGRPKRYRPLPEDVRRQTGERRKDKKICIPCKMARVSCDKRDEDTPCERCSKSRRALVCVPAEWSKHILNATCDSLFHRTIIYKNPSTGMPVTKILQPTFKLHNMLSTLHKLCDSFMIRVRHVSSFTYLLNLDTCYGLLSSLKKHEFELKDIFHGEKPVEIAQSWAKAAVESEASTTEAERLSSCMLMPGMADFELVPRRTANLPRWAHEDFHMFAANLNRIPLRAFEILGHSALQKACNSLFQTSPKMQQPEIAELGRNLGKVVCSQRLRQAWSLMHESPLSYEGQRSSADLERLIRVICSLYFWYIRVQKKFDRKVDLAHNSEQNFFEINGRKVADPLPVIESKEQYDVWCKEGQVVLLDAGLGGQAPFFKTYMPSLSRPTQHLGMH